MKGKELKALLKGTGLEMKDIASKLDLTPQGLSFHLRKDITPLYLIKQIESKMKVEFPNGLSTDKQNNINLINTIKRGDAISLESYGKNVILVPLIDKYAHAGYMRGYGDTEFMDTLPTIAMNVDRLPKGDYRAFEVRGESMNDGTRDSICEGDILIGRNLESDYWKSKLHIHKWNFIIVHKTDGILVKQIVDHDVAKGVITIHSTNKSPEFKDEKINLSEVAQLFNVVRVVRDM
jgi:hypothetical protein